jgi:peptidoglycan LD-endopeptidase LytH
MRLMSQGNGGRDRLQGVLDQARPWLERVGNALTTMLAVVMRAALGVWEGLSRVPWSRIRPGWYVIVALGVWSVVASAQWWSLSSQLSETRAKLEVFEKQAALENAKLSFPIAGVGIPRNDDNLPGAPRTYRKGVSQGFVFTGSDSGVNVAFGTPVIAAADAKVVRLDANFKEATVPEFLKLLNDVKNGASDNDLEKLRGRQVWLEHANGTVTRYGHLSRISPSLSYATDVKRGDVIGFVGNSGTLEGVRGTRNNARLLFEVWLENETKFLGQSLKPGEVRAQAAKTFKAF